MEQSNRIQRSEVWEQIYKIVKQIPQADTNGCDAPDAPSVATELEELFLKLLPIQHVSSRFNLVADVMPARNEYVLIKTPYCKYPATVGFWNGVKWLAADDKCEIFNVSEWLSLNGC